MSHGEVKRHELLRALRALGGRPRHKGGEIVVWFPGTTIIVGRRNFTQGMLRRVARKLTATGIAVEQFDQALRGEIASEVKA